MVSPQILHIAYWLILCEEQGWDTTERGAEDFANDVSDVPENVERNVQEGYDDASQAVEDAPEDAEQGLQDAAGWVGEKVGDVQEGFEDAGRDVQQFGDGMSDAYDQGEQEGRND